MLKVCTIFGWVVSAGFLLLFGADLAAEFPFHRQSIAMDIAMVVCAVLLGYMSIATLRELP